MELPEVGDLISMTYGAGFRKDDHGTSLYLVKNVLYSSDIMKDHKIRILTVSTTIPSSKFMVGDWRDEKMSWFNVKMRPQHFRKAKLIKRSTP